MKKLFTLAAILTLFNISCAQVTIEQKLLIVQNDGISGGNFKIAIQVKGTNLTAANTLGSATIDVVFENTKLTYVDATLWAFGSTQGYSRSATNNTTFIRVGVLGTTVNGDGEGIPAGFDITSSYTTWVQLNFTITPAGVTGSSTLTIAAGSNAIGLFENHSNEPNTAVINNQTLTAPEAINNAALPVELTSFEANANNSDVVLSWQTSTEVNNLGFEIERTVILTPTSRGKNLNDDRGTSLSLGASWESLGFVEGNGNSNSAKEYSFVDKSINGGGKFQYRLKQIDMDGSYSYTDAIDVTVVPTQFKLSQNYPNPFNPTTVISYRLPVINNVQLKIYDVLGNEVATLVNEQKEPGYYEVEFNASQLTSGVYIFRMKAGNYVNTKKMILLR